MLPASGFAVALRRAAAAWFSAIELLPAVIAACPDPLIWADEPQLLSREQLAMAPNTSS